MITLYKIKGAFAMVFRDSEMKQMIILMQAKIDSMGKFYYATIFNTTINGKITGSEFK